MDDAGRMKTKFWRFGLVGFPLEHSLSPRLHRAALSAMGLDGEYRLFPVLPGADGGQRLADLLRQVRHGELHGLNVTIPHKQAVLPYLDGLTPATHAIGAVNTIFRQGYRLLGDNTDAPGFLADLEHFLHRHSLSITKSDCQPYALLLGAGGAARAVAYALLASGWQVTIAARRLEQASQLVEDLKPSELSDQPTAVSSKPPSITAISLDPSEIGNLISKIDLIVNATPLGMHPNLDTSPWPEGLAFPEGAALYDLVYNPSATALVRAAHAVGLPAATGRGMLIEQAALSLERWTGQVVSRQAMWEAIPD